MNLCVKYRYILYHVCRSCKKIVEVELIMCSFSHRIEFTRIVALVGNRPRRVGETLKVPMSGDIIVISLLFPCSVLIIFALLFPKSTRSDVN